ncbi:MULTISPECIES: nucleotide sugar dehydrogenase [unclassified Nocardia]|uniref:nucleotide sugar dehydrogenase n=1 Tax=unclassified Nocardia TaxID=2637762 RepID=UPI001CE47836|nr:MULTISPECIES: nucleotide sugar dehydrogenase [unclassified Nocardia]
MFAQRLGIIGIGYVGLPLAAAFAEAGYSVVGIDIDRGRVDRLNAGLSPIDTVTDAEVAAMRGRFRATTDPAVLSDCETIVVCVPTPIEDERPDLGPLTSATTTVRDRLRPGQLIIVESTTYPGTTHGLLLPILEESGLRAGVDFALAYSPERIDPGNTRFNVRNTPRVVGGLTETCARRATDFYRLITEVHPAKGMREAEAAKILENTFRQINIALVNEFAQLCHSLEIDVWDTISCAATKPYGYMPFWPGAGVGGHCIPVDPLYLVHHAASLGLPFHMAETANRVNKSAPLWVADRGVKHLEDLGIPANAATVLLLGVTYKPDTADTRNTPAVPIVRALRERGVSVMFHDPYVDTLRWPDGEINRVPDLAEALREADLTILLQRHRGYDLDLIAGARRLFDTTGSIRSDHVFSL